MVAEALLGGYHGLNHVKSSLSLTIKFVNHIVILPKDFTIGLQQNTQTYAIFRNDLDYVKIVYRSP